MDHPLISLNRPQPLVDFPVSIRLLIQWGDQDAFGHVNNTAAIRWFESARIAYLDVNGLGHLMAHGETGVILASITCHYRKQLLYPDAVHVGASVTKLGRTSLVMKHLLYSEKLNAVAAEGESVIVLFDYTTQRPIRIPEELRTQLEKIEGKALSSA
jgi:acyl-CoA thioester hydrolase